MLLMSRRGLAQRGLKKPRKAMRKKRRRPRMAISTNAQIPMAVHLGLQQLLLSSSSFPTVGGPGGGAATATSSSSSAIIGGFGASSSAGPSGEIWNASIGGTASGCCILVFVRGGYEIWCYWLDYEQLRLPSFGRQMGALHLAPRGERPFNTSRLAFNRGLIRGRNPDSRGTIGKSLSKVWSFKSKGEAAKLPRL